MMTTDRRRSHLVIRRCLVFTAVLLMNRSVSSSAAAPDSSSLLTTVATRTRRWLNVSGLFGSATKSATVYDRIAGHPVFSVTTPWGSPYMNMEKLSDTNEVVQADDTASSSSKKPVSISEEQNEVRMVALYFLDPDDAVSVLGEMKQMENMENADIRITATSLAKALRQASNLGNGLLTGMPPDSLTGQVTKEDGGTLRYKLVPPKRQLYYAARCRGKERVGLFADSAQEDAATAIMGNGALEAANLLLRREKRERKMQKKRTAAEQASQHMEGYTGIPVFYAPEMCRRPPFFKRLFTGTQQETPLFFNYEDLLAAWDVMRKRSTKSQRAAAASIPTQPTNVEVFNLWDVLTSMDRQQSSVNKKRPSNKLQRIVKESVEGLKTRFSKRSGPPDLGSITFVPSSRSVRYKESLSTKGNGKARLRPMRQLAS
jgi:hypothetical protein